MPKDYASLPATEVRRKDRAVDDEAWMVAFLKRAAFGHMATVHGEQPFINSNIFVYDASNHCIYLHTAQVGRTQANVAHHQKVCFSVSEMGRMLPADTALEFSVEYAGVMIFGLARIVDDNEAEHGLQLLLDKYAPHLRPGQDYRPIQPEELKRTAVYRIDVTAWSGKQKQVAADFPGAYTFQPTVMP